MGRLSLEERLQLHRAYWAGEEMSEPIVSFRIGDYFFANKFEANNKLLIKDTLVTPDMVEVDRYLPDYERMFQECEETEQSAFWTAEPCTGIPWIEAMMGCQFKGEEVAFMALPTCDSPEKLGDLILDPENPWFLKYMEFTEKLTAASKGRFPVGQPILRGVTDVTGTKMGQGELPYAVMDEPEYMQEKFDQVAEALRMLVREQRKRTELFHGGMSAGFYHLWAPGSLVWYQEDLAAILSKNHYNQFLRKTTEHICEGYDYTFAHLHPNSFFHLDDMLQVDVLKGIQINKDVAGPSVEEMLPLFRKIIDADRCLIVFGDLDEQDITLLMRKLPHKRLFLNVVAPSVKRAAELNRLIVSGWK